MAHRLAPEAVLGSKVLLATADGLTEYASKLPAGCSAAVSGVPYDDDGGGGPSGVSPQCNRRSDSCDAGAAMVAAHHLVYYVQGTLEASVALPQGFGPVNVVRHLPHLPRDDEVRAGPEHGSRAGALCGSPFSTPRLSVLHTTTTALDV